VNLDVDEEEEEEEEVNEEVQEGANTAEKDLLDEDFEDGEDW